jgi:hypothetical protein
LEQPRLRKTTQALEHYRTPGRETTFRPLFVFEKIKVPLGTPLFSESLCLRTPNRHIIKK